MSPSRSNPMLIPQPRKIIRAEGDCHLHPGTAIQPASREAGTHLDDVTFSVLQRALEKIAGASLDRSEHPAPEILFRYGSVQGNPIAESYLLEIDPRRVTITAHDARGSFYATQTLVQLIRQYGSAIPCMRIEDAPDLPVRGTMFDISRGKVPTLKTLKHLVEWLAALKYNQLQLYIEHTFAFARHPLPGEGHSPLTAEDIRALDEHCRRFHIDLVPNLQSFGHHSHTLRHARYAPMAESDFRGGWTLSPAVPETYQFLAELYEEFLPLFSHRPWFNADCDETWDLGRGRSAELAKSLGGKQHVWLRHLLRVRELAAAHGRRTAFWADMAEESSDIFKNIPDDMLALHWWYESEGNQRPYLERTRASVEAGLDHWVCPGTSAWLSFFFRKPNARGNLRGWARAARESGATGYLVTDWGDFGHHNCLSYSYWPLAYGADCAWRAEPDTEAEAAFDRRFFMQCLPGAPSQWSELHDRSGSLYQLLMRARPGVPNTIARLLLTHDYRSGPVGSPVVHFIDEVAYPLPAADDLVDAVCETRDLVARLGESFRASDDELDLVHREWRVGLELHEAGCRRALAALGDGRAGDRETWRARLTSAIDGLEEIWMARNRASDWCEQRARLEYVRDHAES